MTANACHVAGCVLSGFHRGRHYNARGQWFIPSPPPPPPVVEFTERPRPVAVCGTPSGYQRHRRLNEKACRACLHAIAEVRRAERARQALEAYG